MKANLPHASAVAEQIGHTALTLKLPPDLLAAMDAYTVDANGHPDRSVLLLRIVRDWLNTNGYLRSDPLGRGEDDVA